VAPQRDQIFKQKVNDCVQHIILQKFTNFHAIRSWSFQNMCNEIGWPRFLRHPVYYVMLILFNRTAQRMMSFTKQLIHMKTSQKWNRCVALTVAAGTRSVGLLPSHCKARCYVSQSVCLSFGRLFNRIWIRTTCLMKFWDWMGLEQLKQRNRFLSDANSDVGIFSHFVFKQYRSRSLWGRPRFTFSSGI